MAKSGKSENGKKSRSGSGFDLDDPKLPPSIEDNALASGGYPYDKKLKREAFETELLALQTELVKLHAHIQSKGERLAIFFEGRDAAGKGSCISHFREHLNPRYARIVALTKPSSTEAGQWYFQRYLAQMPGAGEIALFDRSWYNRAGVERVMSFCTEAQHAAFLRDAPELEELMIRDGLKLFKIYLDIGREMQLMRFHERRHDPLKRWKISDIDLAAMQRYDDYTKAKDEMLRFTHTAMAPWSVILANDQRRARLEAIRIVLSGLDYDGKDKKAVGTPDTKIILSGESFARTSGQSPRE